MAGTIDGVIHRGDAVRGMAEVCLLAVNYAQLRLWSYESLAALHWRWYWHSRPGAWLQVGDLRLEPGPGEVVLIPPGTDFRSGLEAPVGQLYFHFNVALCRVRERVPIVLPVTRSERARYSRLAGQLRDLEDSRATVEAARMRWEVLAFLYQALASLPPETWCDQPRDEVMERIVGHLFACYPSAPGTAELALLARMSPNSLLRRFRAATGLAPRQFVQQLRMDDACTRLQYTTASLEEIAEGTGFCDRYHFSKIFRRLRGQSPAAFRRAHQRI